MTPAQAFQRVLTELKSAELAAALGDAFLKMKAALEAVEWTTRTHSSRLRCAWRCSSQQGFWEEPTGQAPEDQESHSPDCLREVALRAARDAMMAAALAVGPKTATNQTT